MIPQVFLQEVGAYSVILNLYKQRANLRCNIFQKLGSYKMNIPKKGVSV